MDNNKDKPDEKQMNVDAEKIFNHINYTRHWLDRADEDYKNNRFTSGGMVLGLARAELTAAWEEALQLKTQVFHRIPRKAKNMANWKNASAAGLLAAGFLMAFLVIQFGNSTLLNTPSGREAVTDMPSPVIVTEERVAPPSPAVETAAPEFAEPAAPAVVDDSGVMLSAPQRPAPSAAAARKIRRTAAMPRKSASAPSATVSAPAEKPAPAAVDAPEAPEVIRSAPEPVVSQPAPSKPRHKIDGIDLYRTASDAINR